MTGLLEERLSFDEWFAIVSDPIADKRYLERKLGPAVGRYLAWKQNEWGAKKGTIVEYEVALAKLCWSVNKAAGEVTVDDLRSVRDMFVPGQHKKITSAFRDCFRWLYEEGEIETNPAGRLRFPKAQPKPITDLFTEEEKAAILTAQEDPMDRVGVLLFFRAGLRKAELRHLRVRDCNMVEKYILVRRGKGEKFRRVPIKGQTIRALELLFLTDVPGLERTRDLDDYLLCPRAGGRSTRRVPERPMSDRACHEWWYGCLQRAGVVAEDVQRGRRMHASRHTYATDLGRATGWNMLAVQKNLGHASIALTVDTYTEFAFDDQAEAVSMLPEIEED